MNVRTASFRAIDIVFALAMIVTYGGLGAGIFGLVSARAVSLIVLIGSAIGGLAATALFVLGNREFRSHQNDRQPFIRSVAQ